MECSISRSIKRRTVSIVSFQMRTGNPYTKHLSVITVAHSTYKCLRDVTLSPAGICSAFSAVRPLAKSGMVSRALSATSTQPVHLGNLQDNAGARKLRRSGPLNFQQYIPHSPIAALSNRRLDILKDRAVIRAVIAWIISMAHLDDTLRPQAAWSRHRERPGQDRGPRAQGAEVPLRESRPPRLRGRPGPLPAGRPRPEPSLLAPRGDAPP